MFTPVKTTDGIGYPASYIGNCIYIIQRKFPCYKFIYSMVSSEHQVQAKTLTGSGGERKYELNAVLLNAKIRLHRIFALTSVSFYAEI